MSTLEKRFWARVEKTEGCWLWRGTLRPDGYGVIGAGGRKDGLARTHRLAWELANGPIPEGLFVCHKCDVPACCNPAHLFLGTPADNHNDMRQKGREVNPPKQFGDRNYRRLVPPNGELNPAAKLNREKVAAIRAAYASGVSRRALAAQYGVSGVTVWKVVTGQSWR